ncbi:MAG: hypothetical protein ACXVPQ_00105 [Bacteroidia bacterium]
MKHTIYTISSPADEQSRWPDWSELVIRSVITGFSIVCIVAIDVMIYGYLTHS